MDKAIRKIFAYLRPGVILVACLLGLLLFVRPALAFCGFYVAQADTSLYNHASQVIIAKDGDRTVLTMANDYQGEAKDFALVVPVPVVLQEDQVNVGERKIIERLDNFSAPRLVEYFDSNPCDSYGGRQFMDAMPAAPTMSRGAQEKVSNEALGVTIENQFSVGEYDILILSAKESNGLETWLSQNNYRIPAGATDVLGAYIKQGLKFFVAKVNLKEFDRQGFQALRPLMMAYESPRFMLPIRLGMVNADGPQELIVYLLSPRGAVEITNYRTEKIPSNLDLPEFVQGEFGQFYGSMFDTAYKRSGKNVAFLEYSWDMGSCDPCSADPLSPQELREAGVFWLDQSDADSSPAFRGIPLPRTSNVFITRLHLRYTPDKFPEDLRFQNTANQDLFQGRYVLRRPYRGEMSCTAAKEYRQTVQKRQREEAKTLANLTGWPLTEIENKIDYLEGPQDAIPWWRKLWPR
ncbi:DUF2330 domain-containing protein [Synechocystis salina LEGE 06099]|uniref:DUF2330 domain-containing protein n=1 Tax=Synechocystis salina TaxID=945780 RepID=UPI0018812E33|nr:DUF2330 domain-containing protein [Synechocystis salina]MBE9204171.1 DUF2330 domain-containing protein [Synechocystis salina LEGE 06099]